MIFSEQELICFNSVLDGETIFGTRFSAPSDADEKYINKTVESLKKKELADKNGEPLPPFIAAVKILEAYKSAETHVFFNRSRIALVGDYLAILAPVEGGYELIYMNKLLFLQSLVLGIPMLNKANVDPDNPQEAIKTVKPKKWAQSISNDNIIDACFWAHKFRKKILAETDVLYSVNGQGYIYNVNEKRLEQCGSRKMRLTLLDVLEIDIAKYQAEEREKANV